jgi:ATP-dependent DNA helicase RecG
VSKPESDYKGLNRSFDTIVTDAKKADYSITLLEATYLE